MRYKIAEDARPQVKFLLIATIATVALWFIPYAGYLVYPINLFTTFIHESSHVLASLLTGGSIQSLTIAADTSGVVYTVPSGFFGKILTSSAGYLGTTAFGVLLLVLMRKNFSPNKILYATSGFVAVMMVVFTIISPIFNIFSLKASVINIIFTIFAATALAAGLFAVGKFASPKVANFVVAFLAIQCMLNAMSDLKFLFFANSPFFGTDIANDAANMADATGIPAIGWVLIWIGISVLLISLGLRVYAVSQKSKQQDLPFAD